MALLTENNNDEMARTQALDIHHSFIVQSPAGSGKTQLLILRFLALLARVNKEPEEILAITFTRKAAAEMRERILQALRKANEQAEINDPLSVNINQFARQVLLRDSQENWHLLENPNRLRIQTIDAFCAYLTRQMPISTDFTLDAELVDDPVFWYRKAARETLNEINHAEEWSCAAAVEQLLLHLDNSYEKLEQLLADMLAKRDQWVRYLPEIQTANRHQLEQSLVRIIEAQLERLAAVFPGHCQTEMLTVLQYAADQFEKNHPLNQFMTQNDFPTATVKDYSRWKAIADLWLTKEGEWRKTITERQGFPAKGNEVAKAMKQRAKQLLSVLSENELLGELLAELNFLPPAHYSDQQWLSITAMLKIFLSLLAHLTLLFQQFGVTDYIEIALKALAALGDSDIPSDLALLLDQQIRHILVDEFQDTSSSQYALLEKLVAGWQPDDGRTLFLVGDPMQSIYRFRKAEVGLFLKAAKEGIGAVSLKLLTLHANFRATAKLVEWTNHLFTGLMPLSENLSSGAIRFNPSAATKNWQADPLVVNWYPLFNADDKDEAQQMVAIIQSIFSRQPEAKIAILVRARSHAKILLPSLRSANIAYQAVELESLLSCAVIGDLLALTRAFLNPADRIAWLAILRAPWCGLLLTDLYQIAGTKPEKMIWEIIADETLAELSQDGTNRLARLVSMVKPHLQQRGSLPLAVAIEKIWHDLQGPGCLTDQNDIQNSKIFFEVLANFELTANVLDMTELERRLKNQYATAVFSTASTSVEVMTIYKAKGLEFDHVILPGLERKTAKDEAQLLLWSEYVGLEQENHLLLGPIKHADSEVDQIYRYLSQQESEKARHERLRLFYVAVTRAKQTLHLIGSVNTNVEQEEIKKPIKESFLGQIWSYAYQVFKLAMMQPSDKDAAILTRIEIDQNQNEHKLKRLKSIFFATSLPLSAPANGGTSQLNLSTYSIKQHLAQSVGTVIHQQLQHFTLDEAEKYFNRAAKRQALLALGVSLTVLDEAVDLVERALKNILACDRGRWIFSPEHTKVYTEYPLGYLEKNRLFTCVIDRTFVDQQGVRWIIDFKTHIAPVEQLETFLPMEKQLYLAQLERYASLLQKMDHRPIQLGLYFPLQSAWVEWEAGSKYKVKKDNNSNPPCTI